MNGADLLAGCLRNEGIGSVFGVPGEETGAIIGALEQADIHFHPCHDQSAAAIMAAVYGAMNRKPGVLLVSRGPGTTRAATGLASCTRDGYPLVTIVASSPGYHEHLAHQGHLNAEDFLRSVTKQTYRCNGPRAIPEVVRDGFRAAYLDKPGAVALIVPGDVATAPFEHAERMMATRMPAMPVASNEVLLEAMQLLADGDRPVILAGHGAVRAGAHEQLARLAEKAGLPVVTTYMGKAAISWSHQMYAGSVGRPAPDHADALLQRADVVLAVGYCPDEYAPNNWNRGEEKAIIHLGASPCQVERAYNPAIEVIGCIRKGLGRLAELIPTNERRASDHKGLAGEVRDRLEAEMEAAQRNGTSPLTPQRLVMCLSRALREPDVLTVDVGAHQDWACRLYPLKRAGTFWTSHSFGAMGFAIPAAIGAAMGLNREHRCVALCGDGGFAVSAPEIETAVRLQVPLTVVVASDGQYGQQAAEYRARFGSDTGTGFGPIDYAAIARALGAESKRCDTPDGLEEAISSAAHSKQVVVLEVPITAEYNESLVTGIPAAVHP